MTTDQQFKTCPFCAEEILSTAIKCKHCKENIADKTCPFCGESVKAIATKCYHCKSNLMHTRSENNTNQTNRGMIGFAIASLVLGLLSVLQRIGLREMALNNELSESDALFGLIVLILFISLTETFGILALVQKRAGKRIAIVGVILGILAFLF